MLILAYLNFPQFQKISQLTAIYIILSCFLGKETYILSFFYISIPNIFSNNLRIFEIGHHISHSKTDNHVLHSGLHIPVGAVELLLLLHPEQL